MSKEKRKKSNLLLIIFLIYIIKFLIRKCNCYENEFGSAERAENDVFGKKERHENSFDGSRSFLEEKEILNSFSIAERQKLLDKGKTKYEEIIKNAISRKSAYDGSNFSPQLDIEREVGKEKGCWMSLIHHFDFLKINKCEDIAEGSRSILAILLTKCHFIKANRPFPSNDDGCYADNVSMISNDVVLKLLQKSDASNSSHHSFNASHVHLKEQQVSINPCRVVNTNTNYSHSDTVNDAVDTLNTAAASTISAESVNIYNPKTYRIVNLQECEQLKFKIINKCTSLMVDTAFQMYYESLNHIDDICFYIQATEWNRKTETNINRLTDFSSIFANQMEKQIKNFHKIEINQQKQIEEGEKFDKWIREVRSDTSDLFSLIYRMNDFQKYVMDYIRGFSAVFMYVIIAVLSIIITTHNSAQNARIKLFILILISLLFEILLSKASLYFFVFDFYPELHTTTIQFFRWIFLLAGVLIWLYAVFNYKPPILKVYEQMDEIKKMIQKRNDDKQNNFLKNEEENQNTYSSVVNKLHLWANYIKRLRDEEDKDEDYTHFSSEEESENDFDEEDCESVDENIDELIKDAILHHDISSAWHLSTKHENLESEPNKDAKNNSSDFSSNSCNFLNMSRQNHVRRNPHRSARPKTYDDIPIPGQGMLILETPAQFANLVHHQYKERVRQRERKLSLDTSSANAVKSNMNSDLSCLQNSRKMFKIKNEAKPKNNILSLEMNVIKEDALQIPYSTTRETDFCHNSNISCVKPREEAFKEVEIMEDRCNNNPDFSPKKNLPNRKRKAKKVIFENTQK